MKSYNYRATRKNTQQINIITNRCDDKTNKNSSSFSFVKWLLGIGTIISWYSYFFGYAFFKSKMQHLGFEVTLASSNVQEIFYQAYQGLTIGLDEDIKGFSAIIQQNLLLNTVIFPITFLICFGGMYIFKIENSQILMRKNPREWMLKQQHTFKGKIINSLILTGSGFLAQLLLFLIPIVLVFVWIYLYLPASLGAFAAFKELDEFSCDPQFDKKPKYMYHVSCSHIMLKDHRHYVGLILYQDEKNLYLINKNESRTISLADIEDNYREIIARPDKAKSLSTN